MAKRNKKPVVPVPCHSVFVAGGGAAAKLVPDDSVDAKGCKRFAARAKLGVDVDDPKAEIGAETGRSFDKRTGKWKPLKPCTQKRVGCPVQLVMKGGKPFLRFCKIAGDKQPGYMIEAGTPQEALEKAKSICKRWKDNGRSFENVFPPGTPLGDKK